MLRFLHYYVQTNTGDAYIFVHALNVLKHANKDEIIHHPLKTTLTRIFFVK